MGLYTSVYNKNTFVNQSFNDTTWKSICVEEIPNLGYYIVGQTSTTKNIRI